MENLNFFEMLQLIGLVYRVTGKLIFSDHFTTEDWMKLLADQQFVEALRRIFGEGGDA